MRRASSVAWAALLSLVGGFAQGDNDAVPSLELIEFVGAWESAEGDWFDPSQLEGWLQDEEDEERTHEDDA
jgi:hypothetical protein